MCRQATVLVPPASCIAFAWKSRAAENVQSRSAGQSWGFGRLLSEGRFVGVLAAINTDFAIIGLVSERRASRKVHSQLLKYARGLHASTHLVPNHYLFHPLHLLAQIESQGPPVNY